MFCGLVAILLSPLLCSPEVPRPRYNELFAIYGPAPDCMNRDRHVRYLTELKTHPVQDGDNQTDYDYAIDVYVSRLTHYCQ
jgi:hypothetical protein